MSRDAFLDLLRWYAEAGVDIAVGEEPHDRFAEAADELLARGKPGTQPAAPDSRAFAPEPPPLRPLPTCRFVPPAARASEPPPSSSDQAVQSARDLAPTAATLDDLRALLERFDGCSLKTTATQLVFADGNPLSDVMLVGEAPGADEDRIGRPFVGRAGQLLDRMLAAIGLDRTRVYIANVVPWRPPGNRTPTPRETSICLPFVRRQIELVDPHILVCLGNPSAQTLLRLTSGITRTRGQWVDYELAGVRRGPRVIKAMPMLHPAYLLRRPADKQLAWRDLRALARAIEGLQPTLAG